MSDKGSKCSFYFWTTESTHKGCVCRQNVLKAFPRQQTEGQYWKQHFGTLHKHLWSTRNTALWIWADEQGGSSAWTAGTWMCWRPAQASAHNLLTHAGREWSQQSHKSLLCSLHPRPLQRPLFSVLSLPFLKKAHYYPGKSCGFPLISILSIFSCFQAWPNITVIHFHRVKHCLDYVKNPNNNLTCTKLHKHYPNDNNSEHNARVEEMHSFPLPGCNNNSLFSGSENRASTHYWTSLPHTKNQRSVRWPPTQKTAF